MARWIAALAAAAVLLIGCGSSQERPARGPQIPEAPTARRTAPLESAGAPEAVAGSLELVPAAGVSILPALAPPAQQQTTPGGCPLSLSGVEVRVDESEGSSLEFSGPPATAADLERSVEELAAVYARRAPAVSGQPLYRVRMESVPGGARLVFEPSDPADGETLRGDVLDHAAAMRQYQYCPVQ